jgi:mono/diheme cytochrome c family protein
VPGEKPALAGSEWVQAQHPNRIIRAVLYGLTGTITVKGATFVGQSMTPWKDAYSKADIAAVLTFVRGNKEWGNSASAVTEAQVAAILEKVGPTRSTPFTADELLKIPEDQ